MMNRDYLAHERVVAHLFDRSDEMETLWKFLKPMEKEVEKVWTAIDHFWKYAAESYGVTRSIDKHEKGAQCLSDTMITKMLLGTCGCIPAYDQYFKKGIRQLNGTQKLGKESLSQVVAHYREIEIDLPKNTYVIKEDDISIVYPPMKLMDMCFWQIGKQIQ